MTQIRKGFSLIELIIVITVIVILSASIFVYIGAYKKINLDAGASKLASDIRYAQNLAMSTSSWCGISFEVSPQNVYSIYTTTGTIDSLMTDPSDFSRDFTVNTFSKFGISISSVSISGGKKIEFNPMGQPYADKTGSILTTDSAITLTLSSSSKVIRITPNTGQVTVQ